MPRPNMPVEDVGDAIADAIREINAAASTLEARQPSAHTTRAVTVMRFESQQLEEAMPVIREALRHFAELPEPKVSASLVPLTPSEESKRRGLSGA